MKRSVNQQESEPINLRETCKPITIFKKPLPKFFKFFSQKIWKRQTWRKRDVNQQEAEPINLRETAKPITIFKKHLPKFFKFFPQKIWKRQT